MQHNASASASWTFIKLFCFRIAFSFFCIEYLLSPDFYIFAHIGRDPENWFGKLYEPYYAFVTRHMPPFRKSVTENAAIDFIFRWTEIFAAFAGAIIWSAIDHKRKSYNQLNFWLTFFLKYILSVIVFWYGIDKLFAIQMSLPEIDNLDAQIGNYAPQDIFWVAMGAGSLYQRFTGLVEITGSLLILFPRTYILGLVILAGTFTNIVMMNIGLQIIAIYWASVLFITCLYLLAPNIKSIFRFFLHKQSGLLQPPAAFGGGKLSGRLTLVCMILLLYPFYRTLAGHIKYNNKMSKKRESTRLFKVVTQIMHADTILMVQGNARRWKYWVQFTENGKNYVHVMTMSDSASYLLLYHEDSLAKMIHLKPDADSKDSNSFDFFYQKNKKSREKELIDSTKKIKLIIQEFNYSDWELLRDRNVFIPFNF